MESLLYKYLQMHGAQDLKNAQEKVITITLASSLYFIIHLNNEYITLRILPSDRKKRAAVRDHLNRLFEK
jgi:hypothetical protein